MFDKDLEVRRYSFAVLLGFMGLSAFLSFWAVYFESINFSKTQIGYIYALLNFLGALIIPFMNKISSRPNMMQKYMPYIFCSIAISALAFVLVKSYVGIIIIVCFFAITKVPGFAMFDSQVALFANHAERDYSEIRVYGTIGYILVTFCGGYLIDWAGYNALFIISATIFGLCFITMKRFKKIQVKKGKDGTNLGSVKGLFKNDKYNLFLGGQMLTGGIYNSAETFYTIYLISRGFSVGMVGVMMAINLLFEVLTLFVIRKIPKNTNACIGQIYMGLAFVLRCSCFAFNVPQGWLIAIVPFQGIQNGCFVAFTMRYINQVVEEKDLAVGHMVNTMIFSVVSGIVSLVGGLVIDAFSFSMLYIILGIVSLIGVLVVLVGVKKLYNDGEKFLKIKYI